MHIGCHLIFLAVIIELYDTLCFYPESVSDDKGYPATWRDNGDKFILPVQQTIALTQEGKIIARQCSNNMWEPPKKEVPPFSVILPDFALDTKLQKFSKYSFNNEPFSKQGIFYTDTDMKMTVDTYDSAWYPFRRDNPEKLLYPHVKFMPGEEFGDTYVTKIEKDCLIIDLLSKNVNGVDCSEAHVKVMVPIDLHANPLGPENSVSFSFEEDLCIGLDLEDSEPLTMSEFAEKGYPIYNWHWSDLRARIFNSTTVEGADVVVDFSNANPWRVAEGEELEGIPILTRTKIKRDIISIELSYTSTNPYALQIKCKNCNLLWKQKENSVPVKCFSNANDRYIESIKVSLIPSTSSDFELKLHIQAGLSEYWCKGHSIFNLEEVSSKKIVVGFESEFHEELVFSIGVELEPHDTLNTVANRIRQRLGLPNEHVDTEEATLPPELTTQAPLSTTTPKYGEIPWDSVFVYLRPFEVVKSLSSSRNYGDVLFHLIVDTRFFVSREQFSLKLKETFGSNFHGSIRNAKYCYQEPLDFLKPDVFWKTVSLDDFSALNSPKYVTAKFLRPARKCIGDFLYGAVFEPFDASGLVLLTTTESLDEILQNVDFKTPKQIVEDLDYVVTNDKDNLTPLDYQYIGDILVKVNTDEVIEGEETYVLCNMTSICNSLLDSAPCSECENSTNVIVAQVENIIDDLVIRPDVHTTEEGLYGNSQDFFRVLAIDVSASNVSGLAFYRRFDTGTIIFENLFLKYIYKNASFNEFEKIVNDNLEIAAFFTESLLNYWNWANDSRIVLKIYINDNLFQEKSDNITQKVEFNITSISVPNYPVGDFGGHVVPLIFRSEGNNPGCYYWDYETSCWCDQGISSYKVAQQPHLIYCNLTHITPFTHLVDLFKGPNGKAFYDFWLDIITLTCSCLSLLGVLATFLAMTVLKKWRKTRSTRILLHLTIATFIQIIAFLIVSFHDFDDEYSLITCATIGALIQYTLLVQFIWMMIIAISNWKLYKYPFERSSAQSDSENSTIFTLLAWGFPVVPVISVIAYGLVESFKTSNFHYDICSPGAKTKLWGFAVPIYTILFMNFVFYVLLIWEFIKICKSDVHTTARRKVLLPILRNLSILFFALGFPWIFGLLHVFCAELNYPNVFSYIFVITAPLQGFIMFLYFVVFNPSVREEWNAYVIEARRKTKEDRKFVDKIINFLALKISDFWYIIYVCVVVSLNVLEQMKN